MSSPRPMSLIDRIKARASAAPGAGFDVMPPAIREKSRKIIANANRFDDLAYSSGRRTEKMGDFVRELMDGDERQGGERPEFEQGPELVEALFQTAYKAAPSITPKRRLARDLYAARRIIEEVKENPRLKDLQEFTAGDTTLSTVATLAMEPVVKEIIERMAQVPPPSPPGQQQQPGGGGQQPPGGGGGQSQPGQGQGQPQPGQGGGQGQPNPGGQQPQQPGGGAGGGQPDPNGGQGGGQGQPDPNGGDEEGQGPPPPPEEKDAEEGDGSEYEQDLEHDGKEFDAEEAERQAELDWEAAYDEAIEQAMDPARMANKMLEAAQRETEELENLRKGIGLEDGEWATMDPSERMALVEQLRTPEMKMLAQVIGRMKRFALGVKATRVIDVNHEAYNVETGNDLRRVLRHQYAYLAPGPYHDVSKLEFYRKFTDKELLQYKMRGSEDVGKGPIVMCIDKSGSMNGQPFHWALAVAEALRRFAADEDRDIHVLFFGSNRDRNVFEFPKGKAPWAKIATFLGVIANGGTEFDGVLTDALERATNAFDGEAKGKADIVFITDGMASLSQNWIDGFNQERNRVGVKVYSVYIGGSYGAADMQGKTGPLGLLDKISDACIPVSELRPDEVREIFAKV